MKVHVQIVHLFLASILLLTINCNGLSKNEKAKQNACVIGAGAVGLASAKHLAEYADDFDIVVFEQKSDVGGLWIYNENIDEDEHGLPVQSSMYQNLRTDIPKELMAYPDYRHFYGEERSCVTHETVLQYLRNYTEHFNLRQYIQFDTIVQNVTPFTSNGGENITQWKIQTKNLNTNILKETTCDTVMIGNGRNTKPRIPKISGIETFPGKVIHSHIYRKPEEYAGKTVAILGAGTSGIDISIDISDVAKKVYLSHNKAKITNFLPLNIVQVPGIVSAHNNELTLQNGSKIIADKLIFCTGYLYKYPFLDEKSKLKISDKRVEPLYKYFNNVEYPSICIIPTYPYRSYGYLTYFTQIRYCVAIWQGNIQLPNKREMKKDIKLLDEQHARSLTSMTWNYYEKLLQQAGFKPLPIFYRKGFQLWEKYRATDIYNYKNSNVRVFDDNNVILILPNH